MLLFCVPRNSRLTACYLGFSSNTNISTYKVESEKQKLTIEEMNA